MASDLKNELRAINIIISHQLALGVMPFDKKFAEFIYHGLKQIDAISFCRICLFFAREPVGDTVFNHDEDCHCSFLHKGELPQNRDCKYYNLTGYLVIPVQSVNDHYGYIIINKTDDLSKGIVSAIRNFANTITISVENHIQKEELRKQNQALKQAKERAEESDRLKTAFLENMSHEIRTPMNAIQGFSQILQTPGLSHKEMIEYAEIITQNSNHLLTIFTDILTLSALDAKTEKVTPVPCSFEQLMDELLTTFRPEALEKQLLFNTKKRNGNVPEEVFLDWEKTKKVLEILIDNSLKFTPKGFIMCGCERKGDDLEFFVKDSGIGIDPENYGIIFERFWQLDSGLSRNHEGNGLGLSIAKGYVELMGGKIWLESQPGKGSTFYFTVPISV